VTAHVRIPSGCALQTQALALSALRPVVQQTREKRFAEHAQASGTGAEPLPSLETSFSSASAASTPEPPWLSATAYRLMSFRPCWVFAGERPHLLEALLDDSAGAHTQRRDPARHACLHGNGRKANLNSSTPASCRIRSGPSSVARAPLRRVASCPRRRHFSLGFGQRAATSPGGRRAARYAILVAKVTSGRSAGDPVSGVDPSRLQMPEPA